MKTMQINENLWNKIYENLTRSMKIQRNRLNSDAPKERFPDTDRTCCRFGRVVTAATVEDDGTEGGISQWAT